MAFAHDTHRAHQDLSLLGWFRDLRTDLADRVAKFRLYRETLNELSSLTDRELEDLGLHRAILPEVARTAAYAA